MISYSLILEIVQDFYQTAKHDVMIGYHFRIIDDFESHIPRIADFWNLQLNGEMKEKSHLPFHLIKVHQGLGIKTAEVGRWIKLFENNLETFEKRGEISLEQKSLWIQKVELFELKIREQLFN